MKKLILTTALALFAAPAFATETMTKWGCEWKLIENSNAWTKVDGGCKHWIGLGYATQAAMLKSPAAEPDSEEPSDPGDNGGEGPGTDPGNGGGDEGAEGNDRGDRGDRPGRGGRGGKGKGRN